ncbi:MAG: hypothetical protein SOY73_08460 [Blautia sp.]|nr:hypothetical protein [Blautia sp.]MDY3999101.1 hypothetical protein [Blautia sp.]
MRKLFYSIGVFLFLGVLTLAYYESYKIADIQDRKWLMEQTETERIAGQKETDQNEPFSIENLPGTAVMADTNGEKGEYGIYYLAEKDGYVLVYLSDKKTVYETTSISVASLPDTLRKEIKMGKYLKDQSELYSFLENYSS